MKLAEKLDQLSQRKSISRATIAEMIGGVSRSTVDNWFRGKTLPGLKEALALARIFGVPLDYLADDSLDKLPQPPGLKLDERALFELVQERGIDELLMPWLSNPGMSEGDYERHVRDVSSWYMVKLYSLMTGYLHGNTQPLPSMEMGHDVAEGTKGIRKKLKLVYSMLGEIEGFIRMTYELPTGRMFADEESAQGFPEQEMESRRRLQRQHELEAEMRKALNDVPRELKPPKRSPNPSD